MPKMCYTETRKRRKGYDRFYPQIRCSPNPSRRSSVSKTLALFRAQSPSWALRIPCTRRLLRNVATLQPQLLVALVIIATLSFANTVLYGAGTTGADFLIMGAGARIEGMAGSGTATASGVDAAYWNPASVVRSGTSEFSFSHAAWFADISYENLGYIHPLGNATSLAFASSILHTGGIPRTFEDAYGLFRGADGTFSYTAMALSASAAKYAGQGIYVGGTAKFVYEDNAGEAAAGLAFDVSGLYISPDGRWSLGMAARNLGSGLKPRDITEPLPSQLGIGSAIVLGDSSSIASLDATLTTDAGTRFSWGFEQRIKNILFLRGGYTTSTEETARRGFTAGVGVHVKNLSIDYSASDFRDLGLVHRFTLGIRGS
jgi:hypothetical protein